MHNFHSFLSLLLQLPSSPSIAKTSAKSNMKSCPCSLRQTMSYFYDTSAEYSRYIGREGSCARQLAIQNPPQFPREEGLQRNSWAFQSSQAWHFSHHLPCCLAAQPGTQHGTFHTHRSPLPTLRPWLQGLGSTSLPATARSTWAACRRRKGEPGSWLRYLL